MTSDNRLLTFLIRQAGQSYCNECLARTLGLPLQQVEPQVKALGEEAWLKQREGPCAGCGATKLVSRRRISAFAL